MGEMVAGEGVSCSRTMAELDPDALAHCAGKLGGIRDLANMAASCKAFRAAAYSDAVWLPLFRFAVLLSFSRRFFGVWILIINIWRKWCVHWLLFFFSFLLEERIELMIRNPVQYCWISMNGVFVGGNGITCWVVAFSLIDWSEFHVQQWFMAELRSLFVCWIWLIWGGVRLYMDGVGNDGI